ncbi:MAG: hypothetical protein WC199_08735 [Dysgonamonadaceae bacterium]
MGDRLSTDELLIIVCSTVTDSKHIPFKIKMWLKPYPDYISYPSVKTDGKKAFLMVKNSSLAQVSRLVPIIGTKDQS